MMGRMDVVVVVGGLFRRLLVIVEERRNEIGRIIYSPFSRVLTAVYLGNRSCAFYIGTGYLCMRVL